MKRHAGASTPIKMVVAFVAVITIAFPVLQLLATIKQISIVSDEWANIFLFNTSIGITKKSSSTSACNVYREYPNPDHHTGLPYLADVFASHDTEWVYFIGVTRWNCNPEFQEADHYAGSRFLCAFPESTFVLSEFVHDTTPHDRAVVIRCRIPNQFQYLVSYPNTMSTSLHVDLRSLEDPELEPNAAGNLKPHPSVAISDTPKLSHLPVCHAESMTALMPSSQTTKTAANGERKHNLTAMTRFKTESYGNAMAIGRIRDDPNKTETSDSLLKLKEWMDYHQRMGIDHFIIYDNNEKQHGPIETFLKPKIDSGLVTYMWFPMPDCLINHGDWTGFWDARGQVAATLSALHRFGYRTKYFAHMDTDEYFLPLKKKQNILQTVESVNGSYEVVSWKPWQMGPCNGTRVHPNQTMMSKWRCFTGSHYADQKLIFRPDQMMFFMVHYPQTTINGTTPNVYQLNDTTEGLLAHYRQDDDEEWRNENFVGLVNNDLNDRVW